jgi:hypothetical protein
MVSRAVSLFRFRSRCLIRISVAPFALRRLIRPSAALPRTRTPLLVPSLVCALRRQGQHRLYHYALHSHALYVSLVSESLSGFPPSCVRASSSHTSVRPFTSSYTRPPVVHTPYRPHLESTVRLSYICDGGVLSRRRDVIESV